MASMDINWYECSCFVLLLQEGKIHIRTKKSFSYLLKYLNLFILVFKHAASMVTSTGEAKVGGPFALTNQDGKRMTDADFTGRFMLFYFGFTHCPDICPDELDKLTLVMHELERDQETKGLLVPIFVSVDPVRDGPAEMKAYLKGTLPSLICCIFSYL